MTRQNFEGIEMPNAPIEKGNEIHQTVQPKQATFIDSATDLQRGSENSVTLPRDLGLQSLQDPESKEEVEELVISGASDDSEVPKYDFLFEICGEPSTSFQEYMGSLKEFLCQNCKTVVLVTYVTPCYHRFCSECKSRATEDEIFTCYIDTSHHKESELMKTTADVDELKSAKILCPNRERGCKEIFPVKNTKEHLGICYYKCLNCPQNCGRTKILKDLGKHLTMSCERRVYLCTRCHEDVPELQKADHSNSCKRKPVFSRCDYCGLEQIEEIDEHIEECSAKPRPCRMNILGCVFVGSKEEIDNHENLENHTELIMSFIYRTKEAVMSLEQCKDAATFQLSEALERLTNIDLINRYLAVKVGILEELPAVQKELEEDNRFLKQKVEELLKKQVLYEEQISRMTEYCSGRPFEWVINNYSKKKYEEISEGGRQNSPPFYTTYCGYRMRLLAYLNGNGEGNSTHLSVYFCIMKGFNDSLLDWPFKHKVTLQLVDRKHGCSNMKKSIEPKPHTVRDKSFQRPYLEDNVGRGFPRFISHEELETEDSEYLFKDSIFITAEIEAGSSGV